MFPKNSCCAQPLWNEFIKAEGANALSNTSTFPIIVALRVRAQVFRGTSLSAKTFANIVDEPVYPETNALHQWHENKLVLPAAAPNRTNLLQFCE